MIALVLAAAVAASDAPLGAVDMAATAAKVAGPTMPSSATAAALGTEADSPAPMGASSGRSTSSESISGSSSKRRMG